MAHFTMHDRNARICALIDTMRMEDIAQQFGISKQRVHQIAVANGLRKSSARRPRVTLEQRFWSKVKTEGPCWLWQGALSGSLGYGQFRGFDGRPTFAHRVSWQLRHGEIPEGFMVLHRCDVPRCVRPEHLYLGTSADNSADRTEALRIRRGMGNHADPVGDLIFSVRLPAAIAVKLDIIAETEGFSRSEAVRTAIEMYHNRMLSKAA